MNDYELMYVLHPRLSEQDIDAFVDNVSSIINNFGEVITVDRWGRRRLAYPIGQNLEGFYVLTTFNAQPEVGYELESQLNLSEDVLRHLLIKGIIPYEGVVKDPQESQDNENSQEENSVEVIEDSESDSEEVSEAIEDSEPDSEEVSEAIEDSESDSEEASEVIEDSESDSEEASEVIEDSESDSEEASEVIEDSESDSEEASEVIEDSESDSEEKSG
ncbi:MAG: 30S ribosomal protein S6 [Dehalococcoidia bacterium]